MKIKKLMPLDAESRRLIDWMEKGVYDALQKKYLKTLLFCICEDVEGPMIEEYSFSFNYMDSCKEEVSMNISRNGNKKNGATFRTNSMDITPDQMRSSACKMIRTLVQLMRTLDHMPSERTILMKLLYYDDITPTDYEPPFFRSCSENEARNIWTKNPLKMAVGNVNSRHLVLALKVKSILDPCEDDNDNHQEEEGENLGVDSDQDHDSSSDSDIRPSLADHYYVAPAGEKFPVEDNGNNSDAETQDASHEDELITQVKDWIFSRHINTFDHADILSNFPDISMALTEDIVEKLLKQGVLCKAGKDSYIIRREKVFLYISVYFLTLLLFLTNLCYQEMHTENDEVKEEFVEMHDIQQRMNTNVDEDYMYMKALYHALPMKYVTAVKLQHKLSGEANQNTVKKLLDRMVKDGYIKNTGKKRLGKLVVQSEASNKKLAEVKELLDGKSMEIEIPNQAFEFNAKDLQHNDHNMKDGSTYGGLHSIGSDLTRTRGQSEPHKSESVHSGQTYSGKAQEPPISSLESGVLGSKIFRPSGAEGSRSTQDKRSRKTSMIKEPILQNLKRQKPETQ
ncbi:meiosis-specific protein PAIR2 isoform X2 [Dendrobium catenatum]|uniref:meiosis-specific protein PAIR2 isoform X2 n=1 Tax=Dendrobium catenatum TaxID=906689 RepID=UPI0010A02CBC|nr:meiosis-specific protein PAIR2 isoform X2 [Dendrobium catenatum]